MRLSLGIVLALSLAACGSHGSSPVDGTGGNGGGGDGSGNGDGGAGGGGGQGGSIGATNPPPDGRYPIQHIIVVVKENHTFDNYFGTFPGAEGTTMAQTSTGPLAVGRPPVQMTRDLCHEHSCALADWNGGGMDHWDLGDTKNQSDQLAFAQYLEADIPNYWQYARNFTLADHFFSSMLGPSFPGHMFILAAQTGWAIGNPSSNSLVPLITWGCDDPSGSTQQILDHGTCTVKPVAPCFDFPTVVDNLPPATTWKFYGSTLPPAVGEVWSMFDGVQHIRMSQAWTNNVVDASTFDADVDSGKLPSIVFLVDQDLNSEHPPFNICAGENWTVGHLNHVMQSPLWQSTAILMTWDDFGGWYDHVPPPTHYGCDDVNPYGLGFRLPLIIVSPYAKKGAIYSRVSQHASIPKFIEKVFDLPPLSSQDPAAQDGPDTDDLTSAFDWTQAPLPPLPLMTRDCTGQR